MWQAAKCQREQVGLYVKVVYRDSSSQAAQPYARQLQPATLAWYCCQYVGQVRGSARGECPPFSILFCRRHAAFKRRSRRPSAAAAAGSRRCPTRNESQRENSESEHGFCTTHAYA